MIEIKLLEIKQLKDQATVHQDKYKEAQAIIAELTERVKELELKTMDISKFMEWGWTQIHFWIMSVEGGRFRKYEMVLKEELFQADLTGEDLLSVNPLILKVWGVKDRKDRVALNGHIQDLVQQNKTHETSEIAAKEKEGAPTAFV